MSENMQAGPFRELFEELKAGNVTRRDFITKATALGVGLPVVLFVLNAVNVDGAQAAGSKGGAISGRSQDAALARPTVGTEGKTRGQEGELKILQWQAPTLASIHQATGTKDSLAASLVSEPLVSFLPDGTMIPNLVTEVPSVENGLLSEDLKTVTYKLIEGLLWSDGEPVTANDIKFTWEWIVNPDNASVNQVVYEPIESIEVVDDLTATITFKDPSISWFVPFSSSYSGAIYPAHLWEGKEGDDFKAVSDAFRTNPIGTGPYVVSEFKENDQVTYAMNENYRDPAKPYFSSVNLKGGGDAASAAQAVLQTGDWDFAWNLQVEPQILAGLAEGGKGTVYTGTATSVERLMFQFADPYTEVDGQRCQKDTKHPFFTDKAVREAISLATDRDTIANQFYLGGDQEPGAKNILTGIGPMESPNTSYTFDVEAAKAALDAAGWVMDGDVRAKDGVELKFEYVTSINAVRQKTQAVNKKNWEEVGFKVQLGQVDAGVYFDSGVGNEQNISHFYTDMLMYTNGPVSPYPLSYLQDWYAGPDGSNIAQKENDWAGVNASRYINPEFDALYDQAAAATDMAAGAEILVQMNDILINDYAVIPVVARASEKYAALNNLVNDNVAGSSWESLYWNICNWCRSE